MIGREEELALLRRHWARAQEGEGQAVLLSGEPGPELLAHHYTEAGLREQTIPYWQKAGQRAVQRSANAEAIAHLSEGFDTKDLQEAKALLEELSQ